MADADSYKLKIDIDVDEFVRKIKEGLRKAGVDFTRDFGSASSGGGAGTGGGGRSRGVSGGKRVESDADYEAELKFRKAVIDARTKATQSVLRMRDTMVKEHTIMRSIMEGVGGATILKRMVTVAMFQKPLQKSFAKFTAAKKAGKKFSMFKEGIKIAGIAGSASAFAGLGKMIIDSSPMLKAMLDLLQTGIMLILQPIGNFIGFILKPLLIYFIRNIAVPMFKLGNNFAIKWGTKIGEALVGMINFFRDPMGMLLNALKSWATGGSLDDAGKTQAQILIDSMKDENKPEGVTEGTTTPWGAINFGGFITAVKDLKSFQFPPIPELPKIPIPGWMETIGSKLSAAAETAAKTFNSMAKFFVPQGFLDLINALSKFLKLPDWVQKLIAALTGHKSPYLKVGDTLPGFKGGGGSGGKAGNVVEDWVKEFENTKKTGTAVSEGFTKLIKQIDEFSKLSILEKAGVAGKTLLKAINIGLMALSKVEQILIPKNIYDYVAGGGTQGGVAGFNISQQLSETTVPGTGAHISVGTEEYMNEIQKKTKKILDEYEKYLETVKLVSGTLGYESPKGYSNYRNEDYYKEGRTQKQMDDDARRGSGERVISPQRQYIRDMLAQQSESKKGRTTEKSTKNVLDWAKGLGVSEKTMEELNTANEEALRVQEADNIVGNEVGITFKETIVIIKRAQDAIDDMAKAAGKFRPGGGAAAGMSYGSGSAADQDWANQYLSGGGSGTQSGGVSDMLNNLGSPKPDMTPQEKISDLLTRMKTAQAQVADWNRNPGMFNSPKVTAMANQASQFSKQLVGILGQTVFNELISGRMKVSDLQFDEQGNFIKSDEHKAADLKYIMKRYTDAKQQYEAFLEQYNSMKGKLILYGGAQIPWEDVVYSVGGGESMTPAKSLVRLERELAGLKAEAIKAGANPINLSHGGIINEHVVGIGKRSGKMYNIGERGPEMISPMWRGHETDRMRESTGDRSTMRNHEYNGMKPSSGDKYYTLNINIDKVAKEVDIEELKRRIMTWIRDETSRRGII